MSKCRRRPQLTREGIDRIEAKELKVAAETPVDVPTFPRRICRGAQGQVEKRLAVRWERFERHRMTACRTGRRAGNRARDQRPYMSHPGAPSQDGKKTDKPRHVPLSRQAAQIIAAVPVATDGPYLSRSEAMASAQYYGDARLSSAWERYQITTQKARQGVSSR